MKLQDALDQIASLADEDVIFAKRPWHMESEAIIGQLDERLAVPKSIAEKGFSYFIEVHLAKEVLEVFDPRTPSERECRDLLLYYAEHDAYPAWVYNP
jgi:hypothetical protein